MDNFVRRVGFIAVATGIAGAMVVGSAMAQEAQSTYRDIEATLGSVPSLFKVFPEEGIAGAWAEFKTVQLNPKTALSGKEKELIGLAVAAQIPCSYLYLLPYGRGQTQWCDRCRGPRSRCDGGDYPALEHGAQWHAGRSGGVPPGDRCRAASRRRADEGNSGHAVGTSRQPRPATSKASSRQHCGAVAPPQSQREGDYSDGKALNPGPSPSY